MNKPNVLFLTIDSLRSDRCYGKDRTAQTPNLDSLLKNSVYFTQAISSADQTGTSLASIFTGLFPITTGFTHFNYPVETKTYLDIFQKNGYYTCGCFPDHDFFKKLSSRMNEKYIYIYDKLESWQNLSGRIGQKIVKQLQFLTKKEPWFFAIHIMDLHNLFALSDEFKTDEYGDNDYDRMLSSIDIWIGNFLKEIDQKNTLIVISSDHGSYIPPTGKTPDEIPSIQKFMKKGKKYAPFLESAGIKSLLLMRKIAKDYRMRNLKKQYSEIELRSFGTRGDESLYDETIRVPLLFSGWGISNQNIIDNLVRHVDIFPTISQIIKLNDFDLQKDGRSLVPMFSNEKMSEAPAYIETGVTAKHFSDKVNPKSVGKIIGIRTSKYKYLRSRSEPNSGILFDLNNDPQEIHDISKENPSIIQDLESKLNKIKNNSIQNEKPQALSDSEQEKAEDLLKKLGYI